ncbi:MAG: NIL domain-containing protein [Vampirovibrionia bacterium]
MIKRTVVLNFPKNVVKEPISYKLVKEFNLVFNILRARIKPNEEGTLVIQLEGEEKDLEKACNYLTDVGVNWNTLAKGIKRDDEKCIHCTACTSLCPSKALYVEKETMQVKFDHEKCIACEVCISACSYKAITLDI